MSDITIVRQEYPAISRPYRLIEVYKTSEGPRTRVCGSLFATYDDANNYRAQLLFNMQEAA